MLPALTVVARKMRRNDQKAARSMTSIGEFLLV